jgi:hypothetical protein
MGTKKYISATTEEGNSSYSHISQAEADARAAYLDANNCINCINCLNCVNCVNCANCVDCLNCLNCVDCLDCARCVECTDCSICTVCINCADCVNSVSSSNYTNLNKSNYTSAINQQLYYAYELRDGRIVGQICTSQKDCDFANRHRDGSVIALRVA